MKPVAVVKIGGALLQNPGAAAAKIESSLKSGNDLVVVHGGGVHITRKLERMQVQSTFVDGLRVTDEVTLHAVAAALMGEVHTSLVAALQRAGLPALGLFGAVRATRKDGAWGLVGTNVTADANMTSAILGQGYVPVIPTLALGPESLLNVNGDETAAAVAIALRADRLVFLTDVEGVLDGQGNVIENVAAGVSLLDAPYVSGGMKPKLRAVEAALKSGVSNVYVGRTVFGSSQ